VIERYVILASRIRLEVDSLERVVDRAERGIAAVHQHSKDQDLYLDAVALNLHDFYAGIERAFRQIATSLDHDLPSGPEWHRDLLRQMCLDLPEIRPPVISPESCESLEEFLRFRHVVQNIYAFEFDPERISLLVHRLRLTFDGVRGDLLNLAGYLEELASSS
jgi:hypothetical protein